MYWVGFPNTHMDHVSKFHAYTQSKLSGTDIDSTRA